MCPGIVFLWQVNNCPVGFLDTLLKAELWPKKFEFSEFFGLVPSLESPTPSVASKSVIRHLKIQRRGRQRERQKNKWFN